MKNKMTRDFRFTVKSVSDTGSFVGLGAVYGNVDLGNDVIEPGAFTKTLKERGDKIPMLWQHDSRNPIALGQLKDSPEGLMVEGQLVMEVQQAREAHALMKAGVVTGMSIGYDTIVSEYDKATDIRKLKELRLWEISLVTFPMNPKAQVTDVKAMGDELDESVACVASAIAKFQDEVKAGRTLSAANIEKIRSAMDAIMAGHGHLEALMSTTEEDSAGKSAAPHDEGPDLHPAFNSISELLKQGLSA